GSQVVNQIILALRGTRRDHRATARVLAPEVQAMLALVGGLEGKEWRGTVAEGRVTGAAGGADWELEHPAALRASDATASLGQLCLRNQSRAGGRVCGGGAWHGNAGWQASGTIEHFPLAMADSMLPPGDSLLGTLEAVLDASARDGRPTAHAVVTTKG